MMGLTKKILMIVLLLISISFLITLVSASNPPTTSNNVVFTSYSTNDFYIVESTSDNAIHYWDDTKNAFTWNRTIVSYIGSLAISPDGKYVVVGSGSGLIYLFDQNGNILWTKSFGNALIQSISFSANSNYIDASNARNQAFYINLEGEIAARPVTPSAVQNPSEPISTMPPTSSISTTSTPSNDLSGSSDTTSNSWTNYIVWGIVAIFVLVLFSSIFTNRQTKKPTGNNPPPSQNGMIYAESTPNGAAIFIDGTLVGFSPITVNFVLQGGHTLKATLNGYDSNIQQIYVNAGQTVLYYPTLRKLPSTPPKIKPKPTPSTPPRPPASNPKLSFGDLISQISAKSPEDRDDAQRQLIILVNTEGKSTIQKIIKELEKQPSGTKRELINMLYYLCKESPEGQKITEELINALTYSSSDAKWLIIQTLGRVKDKRALHALESAVNDTDFLVNYWAVISLKSIQEY
jgi:hypothetical protein